MKGLTRKVHLDFHTSPDIPKIGKLFDKRQFQESLKKSRVESITVFAKCHNGYCYFPTKVGKMHPNLDFDLLGAQIEAAHEIGVKTPIYIPVGWSDLDSSQHPDWCVVDTEGERQFIECNDDNRELSRPESKWSLLCPSGDYLTLLERLTEEACERYAPVDGLFYDICFFGITCICPRCKKGMLEDGLDPKNEADVKKYYDKVRNNLMEKLSSIVKRHNSEASVFYNGSCTSIGTDEHLSYQSMFEVEVLPTVEGEFDISNLFVRKLEKFGKDIYGMTARFPEAWGQFGGQKDRESLKFEVASCLSMGTGVIVGDHLHPSGYMDEITYENIGYAYEYMQKYEDICLNTTRVSDVGVVWSSNISDVNSGVNSFLESQSIDFTVVTAASDLSGLRLLIVPEDAIIDNSLAAAIKKYTEDGGALIASGNALKGNLDLGIKYIDDEVFDMDYMLPDYDIGIGSSPMLMHIPAYTTDGRDAGYTSHVDIYKQYFKRTYGHFSGHKNTPYRTEKSNTVGIWERGNTVYFAHDVFSIYKKNGSPFLRNYIMHWVDKLYPERIVSVKGLSTVGRARLRKNEEAGYYTLHLLYAVVSKWDNCFSIDDYPTFYNTEVTLTLPENIKSAVLAQTGEKLEIKKSGSKSTVTVPKWEMHAIIILNW